jgi:hypothetical protein
MFVLIVGLAFHPSSGITAYQIAAAFIIDEDQDGEWKGREPPSESEEHKIMVLYFVCLFLLMNSPQSIHA